MSHGHAIRSIFRPLARNPRRMAADKNLGRRCAAVTQTGRNAPLTLTILANNDDWARCEFRNPVRHRRVGPADGAGNEARIGGELLVCADIDQRRPMWHANQTPKLREMLFNDDTMRPRIEMGAILQLSPHGEIASP